MSENTPKDVKDVKFLSMPEGHQIAYRKIEGGAPGIVFLGGFMSDMNGVKATYFESVARTLKKAYIRFDYSGHGLSSLKFQEGSIGRWTKDALAVLDNLTEGPQILIGSSMGGWIMMLMAKIRQSRIKGLLGIAPALDFVDELLVFSEAQKKALETDGVCYLRAGYTDIPFPITKALIEDAKQHHLLKGTIDVDCPIKLVHGLKDDDVPWRLSLSLVQAVQSKDVQLLLLKEGGHRLSSESELKVLSSQLEALL